MHVRHKYSPLIVVQAQRSDTSGGATAGVCYRQENACSRHSATAASRTYHHLTLYIVLLGGYVGLHLRNM